jgi:tRNA dimethylallyltransferase
LRVTISKAVPANDPIPLPVVLGPTGSGKSELALHLARAIGAEIVSCDSLQIYRGFDIGTAKVPASERQSVPHHLIDIADPTEPFTAGDYARAARTVLRDITSRGRMALVVGGTGFYLRGLLEGLSPGPVRDESLRARLLAREENRPGSMHRILKRLDPPSAARIHPNDKNKTLRALEVRLLEGTSLTSMFERGRNALSGFTPVKIGLDPPRELLYARLNERAARMFEPQPPGLSLPDEVRGLLSAGVPRDAKPFESLGYKQALLMIEGCMSAQEAIASTQQETRHYAKRQLTWFRKEHSVHWICGFGDDASVQHEALALLRGAPAEIE